MRLLDTSELVHVSGGTGCYNPCQPTPPSCPPSRKSKNNNGYGNGPESGPAPGNSGKTGGGKNQNFGPRGAR